MTTRFSYVFYDDPIDAIPADSNIRIPHENPPDHPAPGACIRITGIYPCDQELVIPAVLDGYDVKGIGRRAFCGTDIRIVYIENGIQSIEDEAFKNCRELVHIRLPDTLSLTGNHVFENCEKLSEITLPASVTEMGSGTFIRCQSLKKVTLTSGIRTLGESTFLECDSLTEVTLPDSIKTIGFSLFWHCKQLRSVTLGRQTERIERDAFLGCEHLTDISIPPCICSVSRNAFQHTPLDHSDTEGFHIVDHKILLSYIGDLQQIRIPDGITVIAENAFENLKPLRSVLCPDTLLGIGKRAFQNCDRLNRIQLSAALTRIESGAFEGCRQLTDIRFPDTLSVLEDRAFYGCHMLSRIVIPPRITRICDHTFKDCENAMQIYFSGNVSHIGVSAFEYCKSVIQVQLPKTTVHIGNYAFYGCGSLSEFTFPDAIESIGEEAFGQCHALTCIRMHKWILGQHFLGLGNSTDITFLKEDGSEWITLFYADDWRRYIDVPGRDKLVHSLWYAPGKIDFAAYDTCLPLLIHVEDQIDLTLNRLLTPVQLTGAFRENYAQFLQGHPRETISFILKRNLPEAISLLEHIDFFTGDTLTESIELASRAGNTPILLLLMDLRNRNFSNTALDNLFSLE